MEIEGEIGGIGSPEAVAEIETSEGVGEMETGSDTEGIEPPSPITPPPAGDEMDLE